ncbi:3-hexulose-6-phosphate synthase [Geobacillus sp. BCO2]|nr:3-hexulose-6-phosphate synthase [Geobacillus sp. BCO2]
MNIQLALDRMDIGNAIRVARQVEEYIDWIEVGTSLIKEFGIKSVETVKRAFPNKRVVADIKTMDNAKYECQLCFESGADMMTVMGVASPVTVETCLNEAKVYGKEVMIDLLHVNKPIVKRLLQYKEAIFCVHISKDEQELLRQSENHDFTLFKQMADYTLAVAGGISVDTIRQIKRFRPSIVIIGSAITRSENPQRAAKELRKLIRNGGM